MSDDRERILAEARANRAATRDSQRILAEARANRAAVEARSSVAAAASTDPRYARNPASDQLRASHPDLHKLASADGPVPTLFETGDLPSFTASGLAPTDLLRLPWQVRHPAARADLAGAYALFQEYETEPESAEYRFNGDADNSAYIQRVSWWAAGYNDYDPATLAAGGVRAAGGQALSDTDRARAEAGMFDQLHAGSPLEAARLEQERQVLIAAEVKAATQAAEAAVRKGHAGVLSLRTGKVT